MNIQQLSDLIKLSVRQIRSYQSLASKKGDNFFYLQPVRPKITIISLGDASKPTDYDYEFVSSSAADTESLEEIKRNKLIAETIRIQEQTSAGQERIIAENESEILRRAVSLLSPLRHAFDECKLTTEQAELINKAIDHVLNSSGQSNTQ